MNQLSRPSLLSICMDFSSTSDSAGDMDGLYLDVDEVVWLLHATHGKLRRSKAQCKSSFTSVGFVTDPTFKLNSSCSNVSRRDTLAVHILDEDEVKKSGKYIGAVVTSMFAGLSEADSARGKSGYRSVATILKTGRIFITEMTYFRFSSSRNTSIPILFNFACVHSRVLQHHVHRFRELIDRNSLKSRMGNSFDIAMSGDGILVENLKALSDFLANKIPKLDGDHLTTLGKILHWWREMEDTLSITAEKCRGNGHI